MVRTLALACFASLCALLSSCSDARLDSAEAAEAISYWEPHLLLTSDPRHRKLHVEIDVVEGSGPRESEVEAIRSLLEESCHKPSGVRIVVNDPIPHSEANDHFARGLALKHIDGPPTKHTAFLYLLFFDSKSTKDKRMNPSTLMSPYPGAILIDERYFDRWIFKGGRFRHFAILHEVIHALGLARNTDHSDGVHCTNEGCIMRSHLAVQMRKRLLGQDGLLQTSLCADCKKDLAANKRKGAPTNLRYYGPWFVRSENEYHVFSLPNAVYVHGGPLRSLDDDDLVALRKDALKDMKTPGLTAYASSSMEPELARKVAAALRDDPVKAVRGVGEKLEEFLRKHESDTSRPPDV